MPDLQSLSSYHERYFSPISPVLLQTLRKDRQCRRHPSKRSPRVETKVQLVARQAASPPRANLNRPTHLAAPPGLDSEPPQARHVGANQALPRLWADEVALISIPPSSSRSSSAAALLPDLNLFGDRSDSSHHSCGKKITQPGSIDTGDHGMNRAETRASILTSIQALYTVRVLRGGC